MRASVIVVGVAVLGSLGVACSHAPAARAPLAQRCPTDRVGTVIVAGAPRSAVPQLAVLEGTLDDVARTARVTTLATDGLRVRGFPRAEITVTREAGCGTDLHVAVTLGPRYRIGRIALVSEDGPPTRLLLTSIEDGLGAINAVGGTYVEERLLRALPELRRHYRDAGWALAVVERPRAELGADGTIGITIPIHAGRRFTIGAIRAIGAGRAGREVLDALGLRGGDYYDKAQVTAGIERARRKLDRHIQLRVEVSPDRAEIDVEAIVEDR